MKTLFAYINDPERKDDDFIERLDERVQKFGSKEWRAKQMTLGHMLEQAEVRATKRINQLNERLLEDGRLEDMKKAMKDEEYQKKLLEEYKL